MKSYFLTGCCIFLYLLSAGQNAYSPARSFFYIPDSVTYNAQSFAGYLQTHYKTDEQKLYVIYSWITSTIQYRSDSSYYYTVNGTQDEKLAAVLRRRRGVCEQFALLLTELCKKVDIPAYLVHGYGEAGSNTQNIAHSWGAVYINGSWKLFDPTWDAVNKHSGYHYYMVSPQQFIQTHIPFDPIWQLMENPIGYRRTSNAEIFNYADSISTFLQSDSLQQFIAIDRRMKQMVSKKELFRIWQSYNRMNIAIIGNEQDERLYNGAVENLNQATENFNNFINYRNNQFRPAKSQPDVMAMLQAVFKNMNAARDKINQIGKIIENFQYDTGSLLKQLDTLKRRTDEQMTFLQKYYDTAPGDREKVFYQ